MRKMSSIDVMAEVMEMGANQIAGEEGCARQAGGLGDCVLSVTVLHLPSHGRIPFHPQSTLILMILISSTGFSLNTLAFSIKCTTSMPLTHLPNIVCLSSNQGALSVVTKN